LLTRKVNWVLDLDIRGFFDAIDHGCSRTLDVLLLINQCGSFAYQPIASSVQCLHVELLLALQLDKPHRRSGCRLRNRLRIAIVVLL